MKLIIQIPCFNEEAFLPATVADLPRRVEGFDKVEYLVIDDGSSDRTSEVARAGGVHHIVRLPTHQGLARAFAAGLDASLRAGADVIVNTDADNQYRGSSIAALVAPILEGRAQMVIGARPIGAMPGFSRRWMQRLGSWAVRMASGTDIPDAPSGFRAFHRSAAAQLYVHDAFTYTIDTIIQAGRRRIPIAWVKVDVNPPPRPSRLYRSTLGYVLRSAFTIVRIFIIYKPLRFFTYAAIAIGLPGVIGFARFLLLFAAGDGSGHIQSLVVSAALLAMAAVVQMGGLLADIIAANRRLLEDIRIRQFAEEMRAEDRDAEEASDRR